MDAALVVVVWEPVDDPEPNEDAVDVDKVVAEVAKVGILVLELALELALEVVLEVEFDPPP